MKLQIPESDIEEILTGAVAAKPSTMQLRKAQLRRQLS